MTTKITYQKARRIRKASFSDVLADQLLFEKSIGGAFGKAIKLKTKASIMGITQKFDPLNIAKFLTFGSKLGPALLGRMTGRDVNDIEYFTGRLRPIREDRAKRTATKLGPVPGTENAAGLNDILGKIYNFLQSSQEYDKRRRELEKNFEEDRQIKAEKRHKELLNALSNVGTATIVKRPRGESQSGLGGILGFLNDMKAKFDEWVAGLGLKSLFEGLDKLSWVSKISWLSGFTSLGALALSIGPLIVTGYAFNEWWNKHKSEMSQQNVSEAQTRGGAVAAASAAKMEEIRKSGDEITDPNVRAQMEQEQGTRDDAINRRDYFREEFLKSSGFKKTKKWYSSVPVYENGSGKQPPAQMLEAANQFAEEETQKIFTGQRKDPLGKFKYTPPKAQPKVNTTTSGTTGKTTGTAPAQTESKPAASEVKPLPTPPIITPQTIGGSEQSKNLFSATQQNLEYELPKVTNKEGNTTINNMNTVAPETHARQADLGVSYVRNQEETLMQMIVNSTRVV